MARQIAVTSRRLLLIRFGCDIEVIRSPDGRPDVALTGLAAERAGELGGQHVLVKSDSELLVKQMNGVYQVKNEQLRILYSRARKLREQFASLSIQHVPRSQNSHADRLCNEALDDLRRRLQQAEEQVRQSRKQLERERRQVERLLAQMRELGIEPPSSSNNGGDQ